MSEVKSVDTSIEVTIHGVTGPLSKFIESGQVVLDKSSTTGYRIVTTSGYPVRQ